MEGGREGREEGGREVVAGFSTFSAVQYLCYLPTIQA